MRKNKITTMCGWGKSGGFNVDKFIWGKINPNNVSNMEKYIVF